MTTADVYGQNIQLFPDYSTFTVFQKEHSAALGEIHMNMPGRHNVLNALGAITIALDLQIPFETIQAALQTLKVSNEDFALRATFKALRSLMITAITLKKFIILCLLPRNDQKIN